MTKFTVQRKSKTVTVVTPKSPKGTNGWLEKHGIEPKVKVILYKKVSKDFKTQEGTLNETLWEIGKTLEHQAWQPEIQECGSGKFHACARPYFCDDFRNRPGDRYVAIEIAKKDLYAWENPLYPHKIAFRKGKVLYEVDAFGRKV